MSGALAITSTWVQNCDLNSNRGVGNIYVKNGVGFYVNGTVFEDAAAGVYIDGIDNRNVSLINCHCETNTNGIINYQGSGTNTHIIDCFSDTGITRSNPAFQQITAFGNTGITNMVEAGFGPFYQSLSIHGGTTSGNGTSTYANQVREWYGTANFLDVIGRLSWRSNNNNNASVPCAEIRGVARGNVNQNFGALEFGTGNNGLTYHLRLDESGLFYPIADNTKSLGSSGNRWSVVYAGTGAINTSDANQKQDVAALTDAEQAVAKTLKGLMRTYRFKDSVASKGDKARIHCGVMAQDVQAAFIAQGLDPNHYSVFCSDTFHRYNGNAVDVDADGNYTLVQRFLDGQEVFADPVTGGYPEGAEIIETLVPTESVTQLGVRYDELFAFIISAL